MTDKSRDPASADSVGGFRQIATDFVLPTGSAADDNDDSNILRQPGPNDPRPTTLFMIYLRFVDGGLVVRQLVREFQGSVADAEIAALADAKTGTNLEGTNFGNMVWRRPCYLTFVIDNPGWKFYWRPGNAAKRHEAIRFMYRKNLIGSSTQLYETRNHTFFDARSFLIGPSQRDAFRCINYFRDQDGRIGNSVRNSKYCFQIYLEVPFVDPPEQGEPSHITVLIDPDGQNQGPRT